MIKIEEKPPALSRNLWNELFEYRHINVKRICSKCGVLVPEMCSECGMPLKVERRIFCKRDNCCLIPKYSYTTHGWNSDIQHTVFVCPECGAINWWCDDKNSINDEEIYYKTVALFYNRVEKNNRRSKRKKNKK